MGENAPLTRRALLGSSLALGVASTAFGVMLGAPSPARGERADATATQSSDSKEADSRAQYGFLVRPDHCVNCGECVTACREHNHTPDNESARRTIVKCPTEAGREVTLSLSCMHCEDPACLKVCPAGAIAKGEGGIVTVDRDRCIGCKYCYQACPYGVPHYGIRGMDKCDYCFEAGIPLGDRTYCVQACHVDALLCGKIGDLLERFPDAKRIEGATNASCYVSVGRVS